MTEQNGGTPQHFVTTKNYRRFGEMCDACRRTRVVGLGYGPPGTGKTESAKQYAQWNLFKPFLPETLITFTGRSAMDDLYPYRPLSFASAPLDAAMQQCRTVFGSQPDHHCHERSGRDRTSEPHHWTRLNTVHR